jgi:hypothetical protein
MEIAKPQGAIAAHHRVSVHRQLSLRDLVLPPSFTTTTIAVSSYYAVNALCAII